MSSGEGKICISKRADALDLLKYWLTEAVLHNRIGLKEKKVSSNNVQQVAKSNLQTDKIDFSGINYDQTNPIFLL